MPGEISEARLSRRPRVRTLALEDLEALSAAGNSRLLRLSQGNALTLGRGAFSTATGLDDLSAAVEDVGPVSSSIPGVRSTSHLGEDARFFAPDDVRRSSSRKRRMGLQAAKSSNPHSPRARIWYGIAAELPKHVVLCIRRKARRAAILAAGKGGGHHRRPRRNRYSNVWC